MTIKNLEHLPFEKVVECFLLAFRDYFVSLPTDVEYWRKRFLAARVDWKLSFGMFDGAQLVGYIINAVGPHQNRLTAYNTGTGVLHEYRGQAIVDQLYSHAIPLFKQNGIEKCLLEVICENKRAIKVYKRIGFETVRELMTFSGKLELTKHLKCFRPGTYQEVLDLQLYNPNHYSWESSAESVMASADSPKIYVQQKTPNKAETYFVVDDKAGTLVQLETLSGDFGQLLDAIGNVCPEIKIKNIPSERKELMEVLQAKGFTNTVNQYEMELLLE